MVGKNSPLLRVHKFAFAVNPSIVVGAEGETFAAAIPVYAVLKYGTDATKEEETRFGASIGIGQAFNAYSSYFEGIYFGPTWMGEISMIIPAGIIRLRARSNFNDFEKTYSCRERAINSGHHVLKNL